MILLFNLVCPNGHYVAGSPHEYPGDENPPDQWFSNVAIQFARHIKKHPERWTCIQCGAPISQNSKVEVKLMEAQKMDEAHAELDQVGPWEEVG